MALNYDDEDDREDRTIYIGNLSDKVTENIIYELFFQAGPIDRVALPRDKETDKVKGFAFVTYKHLCSIDYAMNIYVGTKLYGRDVQIKYRNANKNREQQQRLQMSNLQFSYTPNSLLGANLVQNNLNPLALAINDMIPQQNSIEIQNKLLAMANPYSQPSTIFCERLEDYPSMRNDNSGSQRESYVDRRRHHREDDKRSHPYRRSRSRSRERDRRDRDRDHDHRSSRNERRHEQQRPSSSGNYHRWGRR